MMFKLIILSGSRKGQRVNLEAAVLSLGRDADCSIVLDDDEVSGRHAVIERNGESVSLRDLGSVVGTRVNDEAVEKKNLKHGDVIQVGQTRLFVEAMRPAGRGLYGMQVLNRILVVAAFVVAPVAFLFLVAYFEDAYLGISRASLRRIPAAEEEAISLKKALAAVPREAPIEPGWLATNRGVKSSASLSGRGTASGGDAGRPRTVAPAIKIAGVEEPTLEVGASNSVSPPVKAQAASSEEEQKSL